MRITKQLVLIIVLIALVSACSGDGPSRAAEQWFEAIATADGATALKLTCQQYQSEVQMSGFLTAGLGLLVGIDTQSAKADMSDLKFETTSQSGDTATVYVQGEMIISLLGAAMPQQINMNLKMIQEDGKWKVCGEY